MSIEFMNEPVELKFRLHFPPDRRGVARLHTTFPNCTAGAAGGRWRSEYWSPQTWNSKDSASIWARKHHYQVEDCTHCFAAGG